MSLRPAALRLAASSVLLALGSWFAPADAASGEASVDAVAARTASALEEARVRDVLSGHGSLLEILPLDDLERVSLDGDVLELTFEFGKDDSRRIRTPRRERWVVDRGGRVSRTEEEARTLRIRRRVRFTVDDVGIRSVEKGDIAVRWLFGWLDLALSTEAGPRTTVVDGKGRIVLETGPDGRPLERGGAFVSRTARRWLVLEAKGRRVRIPLREPVS